MVSWVNKPLFFFSSFLWRKSAQTETELVFFWSKGTLESIWGRRPNTAKLPRNKGGGGQARPQAERWGPFVISLSNRYKTVRQNWKRSLYRVFCVLLLGNKSRGWRATLRPAVRVDRAQQCTSEQLTAAPPSPQSNNHTQSHSVSQWTPCGLSNMARC